MKTGVYRICPPLLPLAVCLCLGVWLGRLSIFSPGWVCLVGLIAVCLSLVFLFFRSSPVLILCCILAPVWGAWSMDRIHRPVLADHHVSKAADGTPKVVSGVVSSFARHYPGKVRVVVDCREIMEMNAAPRPVSGRILVNIYDAPGNGSRGLPRFGDHIRFPSRLREIRNFANPGGYDYKARMRSMGILAAAHVQAEKIRILPGTDGGLRVWFFRGAAGLRNRFWQQAHQAAGEGRGGAANVLTALVTGKKEGVPAGIRENFARAGISHLLAVSGFHLSIVALASFCLIKTVLCRFHALTITGRAQKAAGILTPFPLIAYALFTGFSPSTQRALVMVAAFMAALLVEKQKDALNTLFLAAILILILDPPGLFSISFQLSFVAVFFIVMGFKGIFRMGWMPDHKGLAWLWSLILVSLFAGIGTAPLVARYFNMVSSVQLFSNLVFVPLVGFVCLPLGITCLVLGWVWQVGSLWGMGRAVDLLELSLGMLDWVTGFDGSWIRVVTPGNLDIALIYLFMGAVWLAVATRTKTGYGVLALVVGCSILTAGYRVKQRFFPGRLSVIVLDVGQGNAAVVKTAGGKVLLIDGGGFSGRSDFDTGRFIVGPYLWQSHCRTLDAVILTHPQADHMNGLAFIMENFRVNQWFRTADESPARAFQRLVALARRKEIPQYFPGDQGKTLDLGEARLKILPGPLRPMDTNNNSLVCRLAYGNFSMLFTGDIEAQREYLLAQTQEIGAGTTLLLAPHHGSRSSSSNIFLDKLNAQGVIISCGYKNRYGFPHGVVLRRYGNRNMRVFRTDLHGAVVVTASGSGYDIKTHRNE